MAHSLEARSPFLDADWVEWTARLPERFKVRGLQTKWLLGEAFADRLPSAITERGKAGFGVPIGPWLQNDLHAWVRELLFDNRSLAEWFRIDAIQQLLVEHDSGKINHQKRIWALLMFSLWHNKYLVS